MTGTCAWPTVPFGDVVEDTQYGTSVKANEDGLGVPVLRMNNITYSGALDLTVLKNVELPPKDLKQCSVRRGDLLFNRTNSQELVGKMAVWNRDEQYAFAGYLVRARLKRDLADPAFAAAWFNSPDMKTLLRTRAKPSINMSNINASELLKFPFVLPPLPEQRRIAEILDRAEALRAMRRAAIVQLDELTQAIFVDMFGDPIANEKGWKTSSLGNVATKITDGTHKTPRYTESGVEFLSAKDLKHGGIAWGTGKFISVEEHRDLVRRCDPEIGDILMAKSGSLGFVAIIDRNHEFSLFESLCLIKHDRRLIEGAFLVGVLRNPSMLAHLLGKNKGIAIKHLHLVDVRDLQLPIPPMALQRDFTRSITAVDKLKSAHRAFLAELDALFDTLQHRAFRGKV